ncbi:hypothetical protein Kpol_534p19 [Vanderwaltozyma polyspora DSM 70294]|uniref:SWI5-dependent HO expression protein 3 n=1 Tax=Vanderwaltozyma polyspora (strain ATCC 22028 / DSM 70294 / BCRC 21397 / CBS 2163 / NBRC 10782 / NRRL Y-8283 / UCD 57-17) TaxID=436907 RepID=SHE3_VANPO|nr:uncharacterized protein Kpol_534p19 [Vanderwaltozyma polyspora DSM 70294]A7TJJ7.1 RecName: Full=SWI5-dependent HO expression protein 3 [Vanderwaltozyma polyspora DSM 70294]EDO17540.1 hypothetical protein Kpol_534p19 [Vanderwaltozyma polyspora DSM 70294]
MSLEDSRISNEDDSELLPPNKVVSSHGVFMASMNGSPQKIMRPSSVSGGSVNGSVSGSSQIGSGPNSNNNNNSSNNNNNSGSISSTKVIEALHEQIDALTNTNLKLTVQSQGLLEKLENSQQREGKFMENIASLRHENDNLSTMLNRKTRKLKDTELELEELKEKFDKITTEKKVLDDDLNKTSASETKLKEEMSMIENQYNSLIDSHEYYKDKYLQEINQLKRSLEDLTTEQENYLKRTNENNKLVEEKIDNYNNSFNQLKEINESLNNIIITKCESAIQELDLPNWVNLYKESKILVIDYAQQMNLEIPNNFKELVRDRTLEILESRSTSMSSQSSSENRQQFNNNNNNSHNQSSGNEEPLRMVKLRTVSPNSFNNSGSSLPSHIKRSSFYGGTKSLSSSNSGIPGTLPGVKRSGSLRKPSSRLPSTNTEPFSSPSSPSLNGTNKFGQNQNQASNSNSNPSQHNNSNIQLPGSRVSSVSHNPMHRKKRNSMMFHGN